MEKVGDMRQREGEVASGLVQEPPGGRVAGGQGPRQQPGFAAGSFRQPLAQEALDTCWFELSNPGIHRPAGTALLDDDTGLIEAQMADLGFAGRRAVKNPS